MKKETQTREVKIDLPDVHLEGLFASPPGAKGVVLFSHGSGSSRHSPRNNFVAQILRQSGIATFLFDLLTEGEDIDYQTRFNIPLLTQRLIGTTLWLIKTEKQKHLSIGYFGASTGAAAALEAAAELPSEINAVVSRGGRPDMAWKSLPRVKSPALLIVGGKDEQVIEFNRLAYDQLSCKKELVIIPGATHLFEEPGALEEVAKQAVGWFGRFLNSERNRF
jgi:putative phosphoribosyl transferase